jgi:Bacterial capsule synthesis protein PGA_cap
MTYQRYSSYHRPYLQQPKRPKKRRGLKLFVLLVIAVVVGGSFFLLGDSDAKLSSIIKKEPPKPQKVRVEGRYLFNGTVVWARHMQEWSAKPDGTTNYAYPFSGLNTFDRAKYDAWTADLECPVFTEDIPTARQDTETAFNCRPEFLPEAAKFFDIFNLANNHTRDFNGESALTETRTHLEKNGLQYFGDFEPGKLNNACEVMALPVRVISKLDGKESSQKGHLPVAFCSWHYFFRLPLAGEIEHMKQYTEVMPTFAFIQAGVEYRPSADDYQRMMAKKAADQGPSFVVVNSAHWVQDGEVYKGVPILYSTGNFLFDQQYNSEVTRSASLDGNMTINYTPELEKWLALGASCKAFHDDCFEQIKQQRLQKPELSFQYNLVAGDNSGKLTKRAGEAIQKAVETRVGWATMQAELKQQ